MAVAVPGGAIGAATSTRAAPCARANSTRGAHGRAGRDAVVDDERGATVERDALGAAAESRRAACELVALARFDGCQVGGVHMGGTENVLVEDAHVALADRAHRELRLERDSELAHDDDVEWRVERDGDLVRDGDATARQAEHHEALPRQVGQSARELTPGVGSIGEHHDGLLLSVGRERGRFLDAGWERFGGLAAVPRARCARAARAHGSGRSGSARRIDQRGARRSSDSDARSRGGRSRRSPARSGARSRCPGRCGRRWRARRREARRRGAGLRGSREAPVARACAPRCRPSRRRR